MGSRRLSNYNETFHFYEDPEKVFRRRRRASKQMKRETFRIYDSPIYDKDEFDDEKLDEGFHNLFAKNDQISDNDPLLRRDLDNQAMADNVDPTRNLVIRKSSVPTISKLGLDSNTIGAGDHNISPAILTMVKNLCFSGSYNDDPIQHLSAFNDICSILRGDGGAIDHARVTFFPMTLAGGAHSWYRSLSKNSKEEWSALSNAFLEKYFPPSKTARLRQEIQTFHLTPGETLAEGWSRFNQYLDKCPHHGLTDMNLIDIFYNALPFEHRALVNAAANGDFPALTVDAGFKLIERMAQNTESAPYLTTNERRRHHGHGGVMALEDSNSRVDEIAEQMKLLSATVARLTDAKGTNLIFNSSSSLLCK